MSDARTPIGEAAGWLDGAETLVDRARTPGANGNGPARRGGRWRDRVRDAVPAELQRVWAAPATHHGIIMAGTTLALAALLLQLRAGSGRLPAPIAWFARPWDPMLQAGASVLGALVLAAAAVWAIAHFLRRFEPEVLGSLPRAYLLASTGLAGVASTLVGVRLHDPQPLALLPAMGMLLTIFLNPRVSLVATLEAALVATVAAMLPPERLVEVAGGCLVAIFAVHRIRQRFDIARAGLMAAGVEAALAVAMGALAGAPPATWLQAALWGAIGGIGSAVVAVGVLPYLENTTGIVTIFKLMELANPSQPLLRHLLMKAPGTYHHSILVGNLGEAAAEAIGADPLLVRVGAYYHDIGKTRRPQFFIENQMGMENRHDQISPRLSTLVITSHVKEGIEMARDHRLPQAVADFIPMHHGTSLVAYFYHQAKQTENPSHLHESSFRYPGPRPNSKETAIVMLADAIEATSRTLKKPTPEQIDQMIRRTVNKRLQDGQLAEAPLTLQDLEKVTAAFNYVLQGLFHHRIEYPDQWAKDLHPGDAKRAGATGA